MSRKRDTNWTRDEITVLLDSIIEFTKMRAEDGRRTSSREVFEYAAKKLGEKGHTSRAEREKCRTKWKKMKEEFNHAKKARETGEGRVAPGIEPFYSRMLEFNNGNFQNISPHSTIVRRSSSISSNINNISNSSNSNMNSNMTNNTNNGPSLNNRRNTENGSTPPSSSNTAPCASSGSGNRLTHSGSRASARIAANINGIVSTDASDTSSTMVTRQTNANAGSDISTGAQTLADSSPMSRQHSRLITSSTNNGSISNGIYPSVAQIQNDAMTANNHPQLHHQINTTLQLQQNDPQRLIPNGDTCNSYSSVSKHNSPTTTHDNNNSLLNTSNDTVSHMHRDTDISYRVSSGFRQITIFGDHDVDIKFRENCVTINKISPDYASTNAGVHSQDS
jgi:hypothetical protein